MGNHSTIVYTDMTAKRHMSVKNLVAVAGTAGFVPNVMFIVRIMRSTYARSYHVHHMFVIPVPTKGAAHWKKACIQQHGRIKSIRSVCLNLAAVFVSMRKRKHVLMG